MIDPYAARLARLSAAVLSGAGRLDPVLRQAAAKGGCLPAVLASYVDKVRESAHRIADEDVRDLVSAGHSEDEIFEVTIAAALGAAVHRLDAGLAALREAFG